MFHVSCQLGFEISDQLAAFCSHMLTLIDFFEHRQKVLSCTIPHRTAHLLPPFLSGLYIFSQCPQTLTAAGAEVWVGAHYPLAGPCQKEGRVFKGSKLRFVFFGLLYFCTGKSNSMRCVMCSMCRVYATSSLPESLHPGNTFRFPRFNELPHGWSYFTEIARIKFTSL